VNNLNTFTVEMPHEDAYQLALFIKRVRHDQCRELTDSGQTSPQRDDQAYAMLHSLELIAKVLRENGYAPR